MDIRTWADLAAKLQQMTPEQLQQPIQCVKPTMDEDDVQEMLTGIAFATVEAFGFHKCRSTHNNKYCPGDLVLLVDYNPYAENGAIAYQLGEDNEDIPLFGKDGPTNPRLQCSPAAIEQLAADKPNT